MLNLQLYLLIDKLVLIMPLNLPISYALEQCSRILPIMLKAYSIYNLLCPQTQTFPFFYLRTIMSIMINSLFS